MGRRRSVDDDDDDDDLPAPPGAVPYRESWDNPKTAAEVRAVLAAFEDLPSTDDAVRLTLQKWLYRQDKYLGGGGAGYITMVLRVFESVNRDALIEPILSAVSFVASPQFAKHGMALLDAIDKIRLTELLATMRGLDVFSERSIGSYLETAIRNKALRILGPVEVKTSSQKKVKLPPKPPTSVTRIPAIEKSIALGMALVALRDAIPCNKKFARDLRKRFPSLDRIMATEAMKIARVYGTRPEIYRRLSWIALFELASPKMSPAVRQALEAKVLAGETITGTQIRKARGPLKGGALSKRKGDKGFRRQI